MGEDYGGGRGKGWGEKKEREGGGRLEKSRQTVEQDYNLRLIKAS